MPVNDRPSLTKPEETKAGEVGTHVRLISVVLLLIGLCIFAMVIARVGWRTVSVGIGSARGWFLLGATLVYICSVALRATKWYVLMHPERWLRSLREAVAVYGIGGFAGFLTPGRSGEFSAAVALNRLNKVPVMRVSGAILADRLLEALFLMIMVLWAGVYLSRRGALLPTVLYAVHAATVGAAIITMLLITAVATPSFIASWLRHLSTRFRGRIGNVVGSMAEYVEHLTAARTALARWATVVKLTILTAGAWVCDILLLYLAVLSFVSVGFADTTATQIISIVASLISAIPSGLGVGALSYTELMRQLGYPLAQTTTAVVLSAAIQLVVNLVMGLQGFLYMIERS